MDLNFTVLQQSKLTTLPVSLHFAPDLFVVNIVFKLVQTFRKPHDALYKVHHEVLESDEPV